MRRARSTMLSIAALALAACTSPPLVCDRDGDCPSDLACGGDGVCGSGAVTRIFVISQLSIPGTDGTHARGFDLDGVVSDGAGTGCVESARDYVSLDDPAVTGVDGALSAMVPSIAAGLALVDDLCAEGATPEACIEETIARSIADGSTLIAIELRDLDSFRDDDEVELVVHRARTLRCGSCAPELEGGALAPDQRFELEPLGEGAGAIEGGVLRASFGDPIALDIQLDDLPLGLPPLRDGRLEARVDAAGLHDALLGGGCALEDLEGICDPGPCDPASYPLASPPDLDPDPADRTSCRRFSAALAFSAVPARE